MYRGIRMADYWTSCHSKHTNHKTHWSSDGDSVDRRANDLAGRSRRKRFSRKR